MSLSVVRQYGVVELHGMPLAGRRRFGVPTGGAFDTESLSVANAVVGNLPGEPAWELGLANATFKADTDCVVGVAGAVARVSTGDANFEGGGAFALREGGEFTIESPMVGARVYVACRNAPFTGHRLLRLDEWTDSLTNSSQLRLLPGPQAHEFDLRALSWPFSVSQTGNRVGIRLEPGIEAHKIELTSEPQCVGTIQVSNDGTLIVIGPDGPTIGGYPKIAVVATCDIPRLAQLRPGDSVRFGFVTVEDARRAHIEARNRMTRRLRMIRLIGL